MASVGGSITHGQGVGTWRNTYGPDLQRWLRQVFPGATHKFYCGAVPGVVCVVVRPFRA